MEQNHAALSYKLTNFGVIRSPHTNYIALSYAIICSIANKKFIDDIF